MIPHTRFLLAAAIVGTGALPALGGDSTPDFSGDGYVELYYASIEDAEDEGGIFGDFTLSFRQPGGSLGFDVGAFAERSEEDGNGILYWAGTWYTPNGGKLSVGNPRSAYDLFVPSVHNDAHGAAGNFVLRSRMQSDEFFDGGAQFGISYLGTVGSLSYGASLHSYDFEGDDTRAAAFGISYGIGDYLASAAVERTEHEALTDFTYLKLGLSADYGTFALGAAYRVTDDGADTERSWESHLIYRPTEKIELTGTFQSFSGDASSVRGLAAQYSFSDKGYARAGVVSGDFDDYHLSVGFQF